MSVCERERELNRHFANNIRVYFILSLYVTVVAFFSVCRYVDM